MFVSVLELLMVFIMKITIRKNVLFSTIEDKWLLAIKFEIYNEKFTPKTQIL